ncbi:alpha/beta hydrolase [Luteimicrobium album]|uniref:Alpha/beta hydrolase n=1 Tax=Luteimicrobium album TaxID=1054550 RepID=A0ABQ6I6I7_9MICO|nr:alpha/beta hydrolase [Luteimicrobium album]GMA25906.1 alpha/beta hydrolase [Luteimicrobium album]
MSGAPAWRSDDELGDAFQVATLPASGAGGARSHGGAVPPRVTLVRAAAGRLGGEHGGRPRAVALHVHGYNDYFFQRHLAETFTGAGYAFVAVDLRRAGRSWRPGEVPHYVDDLHEHAADLALAAAAARAMHPGVPLVVHAHSTGGLTASLWAHSARRGEDGPDLLVLDSPFLDLRSSWFNRTVGTRVLDVVGPYAPLRAMTSAPSVYATRQHASNGGRWEFDRALKRPEGLPVRAGWLRAVRRGQARVEQGLEIVAPVLVARSARSGPDREDNPDLDREDTVLDVRSIARLGPRLGRDMTELVVDGGVHDLTLSADGPRGVYLDGVLAWLDARLEADR